MKHWRVFVVVGLLVLATGWILRGGFEGDDAGGPRAGPGSTEGDEPPARLAGQEGAQATEEGSSAQRPRVVLQIRTDPAGEALGWRGTVVRLRVPNWTKANEIPGWHHPLSGAGEQVVNVDLPQPGLYGVEISMAGAHGQAHRFLAEMPVGGRRTLTVTFVPGATLTGDVRDVTGAALADATVSVFGGNRPSTGGRPTAGPTPPVTTRTDARGAFEIGGLDPLRDYTVAAVLVGFAPQRIMDVRLAPEEKRALRIVLQPAARASGRLLDRGGAPLVGAAIRVARLDEAQRPNEIWIQEGEATTDANGEYLIDSLSPGTKRFFVLTEYVVGTSAVVQWTANLPGGTLTELRDTQVHDSEIVFRVMLPNGDPTPQARIHVLLAPTPVEGEEAPEAIMLYVFTDAEGTGRVRGLPAGALNARVSDMSGTPGLTAERVTRAFDGRSAEIAIQLVEEVDTGIGFATLQWGRLPEGSAMIVRTDAKVIAASHWAHGSKLARRSRTLERAIGTRAKALLVGGGKYTEVDLVFEPGEPSPIELVPTTPGKEVRVRVQRAGRGQANTQVYLFLPSSDGGEMDAFFGMTNEAGELVVDGMPRIEGAAIGLGGDVPEGLRQPIDWDAKPCEVRFEIP